MERSATIERLPWSLIPLLYATGGANFVQGEHVVVALVPWDDEWIVWERPLNMTVEDDQIGGVRIETVISSIKELRTGSKNALLPEVERAIWRQAGAIRVSRDHVYYPDFAPVALNEKSSAGAARSLDASETSVSIEASSQTLSGDRAFIASGRWISPVEVRLNTTGGEGTSGAPLSFADVKSILEHSVKEWNDVVHSMPIFYVSQSETSETSASPGAVIVSFSVFDLVGKAGNYDFDSDGYNDGGFVDLTRKVKWYVGPLAPSRSAQTNPFGTGGGRRETPISVQI